MKPLAYHTLGHIVWQHVAGLIQDPTRKKFRIFAMRVCVFAPGRAPLGTIEAAPNRGSDP